MPIYEYRCEDCGTQFEKLLPRESAAAELVCPQCGRQHLKREFSTFAAHTHGGRASAPQPPQCPAGGCCGNAGACGMNFN